MLLPTTGVSREKDHINWPAIASMSSGSPLAPSLHGPPVRYW
uniref:Uncharacterized protein n=1 Tax=Arundo donax TaxID=35708 RepID=A0A0A8Z8K8_ARUDO